MEGIKIAELKTVREDNRGKALEFSTRATKDFLLISKKKGTVSGEHYHKGKVPQKKPEILILMRGQIELYCKNLKTKEEFREIIDKPSTIQIFPYIWHEVKALTDITFLELNSLEQHQKDTIKDLPVE